MAESAGKAIWSPEVLSDLDEIWNYYERVAGRNTALKIVREVGNVVATIEDPPLPVEHAMSCGWEFVRSRLRRTSSFIEL